MPDSVVGGEFLKESKQVYDVAGQMLTAVEVEQIFGIPKKIFERRVLIRGWSPIEASTVPVNPGSKGNWSGPRVEKVNVVETDLFIQITKKDGSVSYIRNRVKEVYGPRTVVSYAGGEGGVVKWNWECSCGNKGISTYGALVSSKGCMNCLKKRRYDNLTKKWVECTLGDRTIIARVSDEMWKWRCVCGHEGVGSLGTIRGNNKRCRKPSLGRCSFGYHTDQIGKKYGDRVIIGMSDKNESHENGRKRVYWKWKCDCKNEGESILSVLKNTKFCKQCYGSKMAHDRSVLPSSNYIGEKKGTRVIIAKGTDQRWRWRCNCGVEGEAKISSFRINNLCKHCAAINNRKAVIGSCIGKRTITGYKGKGLWGWLCECGNVGASTKSAIERAEDCVSCQGKTRWAKNENKRLNEECYGFKVIRKDEMSHMYICKCLECGKEVEPRTIKSIRIGIKCPHCGAGRIRKR